MIELLPDGPDWIARVSRYGLHDKHKFALFLTAALWAHDRFNEMELV